MQRLQWFSRGIYSVSLRQQDIVISDLRMGVEPHYAFNFKVGKLENPHAKAVLARVTAGDAGLRPTARAVAAYLGRFGCAGPG